ncbi:MAG: hypothetical protein RI947_1363 [Candidatus Parcubacteria bacterium]|jgi:putative peptidoglycan lipid II flippase
MERLLDKTKKFLFAKQTSIFTSTLLISSMIVIARFFGFIRDRVLTGFFSKGELDIYYAAFRIPDLIFEILITGALTTSFIPFFIRYQKNKEQQNVNVSTIINVIILFLVVMVILLAFFMPHLMFLITPGFNKEKTMAITQYSQLLLIGQLPFLVMGNLLTGISQAKKRFLIPAFAPILYNLAIIVTTLFFYHSVGLMAPIFGVMAGAAIFFVIQLPILLSSEYQYQFVIRRTKVIWEFFRTAIPRIFTVVIAQIDATIDLTLATLLGDGSYTIFYLAQRLQLLPVSVIGIAFGQASLPYLSEIYQEKRIDDFKKIIIDSILNIFFFVIPIAAFFMFARTPLVRFFYGGQQFDWTATVQTAITLSYFTISLPFHSIYYFLTRCFYALFDSKTPFYISLFCILINASLSLSFILLFKLPVWSLAISFSSSMTLNVIILLAVLHRRLGGLNMRGLFGEMIKISAATLLASIPTYYLQKLLDGLIFDTSRTINVVLLLVTSGFCYFLLYLLLSWIFNVREIYVLTTMTLKMREYKQKIMEIYSSLS